MQERINKTTKSRSMPLVLLSPDLCEAHSPEAEWDDPFTTCIKTLAVGDNFSSSDRPCRNGNKGFSESEMA